MLHPGETRRYGEEAIRFTLAVVVCVSYHHTFDHDITKDSHIKLLSRGDYYVVAPKKMQ